MNEQAVSVAESSLPIAVFMTPFVAGVLVLLGKKLGRWFWEGISILTSAAVLGMGVAMVPEVLAGRVLTSWGNQLRVDALSALMVVIISGIGFVASLYSLKYMVHAEPSHLPEMADAQQEGKVWTFYWLLLCFLGTMIWGCVTNNVVFLYVAVEATTLASGLLVSHYWDRRALEAGYKYLMLLTIGLTFALFGCVLMYATAAAHKDLISGGNALLLSEIKRVVHLIPSTTAIITVAFLVIGFGTKAGIAPFHPWLPDAHAEAPTPVSVLLSGVMIKMAAYALARTSSVYFPTWPQITVFLVALGAFTMVVGVMMAFPQDDIKRMLAYSSVSQIGYILAGIGLGTYLGCYGGLFHLLNHAIFKGLLFMCAGAIIYATGLRKISQLSGLAKKMPITSLCFFAGALAIAGFPPFNGFFSKVTIYFALAKSGMWWAVVVALFTAILTMVVLVRAAFSIFWGEPRLVGAAIEMDKVREVPASMWVPMVILAAACLLLGLFYQAPYPLLDKASIVLATLAR